MAHALVIAFLWLWSLLSSSLNTLQRATKRLQVRNKALIKMGAIMTTTSVLGENHYDEVGDIHRDEETSYYTRYLTVPDKAQEHKVDSHHDWCSNKGHMSIYWYGTNRGSQSKSNKQIVGKGAQNTTHQDVGAFLASCAYPQHDHLS